MFSQDQYIVEMLREKNEEFKAMYQKHSELNKMVDKAGTVELPLSDDAVHNLKKEKLLLRDKMAEIIRNYKLQSG
ncbi:MAG: DUF465 domain-containing protein [Desulfobulbaceae bacterium]|nr:DUF465 domain-containing protein [Desulfobulbaceae bacterium]